jgi:outer membrane receptor protein involved in Fe transport
MIDGPSICGRYGAYVLVINDRVLNPAGSAASLNSYDPDAIESVDILKPTAAAALYGTAARTGAIAITLKRGMKSPCDP